MSQNPVRRRSFGQRKLSLQVKVVAFLLVIAMVPLAVAAVLIDQAATVAHNFASNEVAFLRPPLARAKGVYLELITAKRDLYYQEVALRIAALPELAALLGDDEEPARGSAPLASARARLDAVLAETRELLRIAIIDASGQVVIARETSQPAGVTAEHWKPFEISRPIVGTLRRSSLPERPVVGTGAEVRLAFAIDPGLQRDYSDLVSALEQAERISEIRSALPSSYRIAFLILVGGVVIVVSAAGIIVARRFTRRIFTLVSGTRKVAAGDLESRVELPGRDELAELARAFNRMVDDLGHDREQIAYLQRVSTWQDVARKLAHEIKNPLTPILLAVQQCVSSYRGDDERYRRLLRDAEEIVSEEIAGLRRLVDAFRTLGQLPRVEARPLDLGTVVDDLGKDPALLENLDIHPPDQPVMVRGDRLLLRRVLANLVENGVHAGQGAGHSSKVVIRWTSRDERAELLVDDHGPGVPADRRDKIFEPYVTHKEQGTGLGLTISKKIAIEHRGSLELAAEPAPTGGARFVLILPLASEESDASEPDVTDTDPGKQPGKDPDKDRSSSSEAGES